ncbi:hypothetical protein BGX27_011584 [Mortierella sp. AM989]|nr:hypothetical protein BGX27_011584 [Mortierella sp. AM989]
MCGWYGWGNVVAVATVHSISRLSRGIRGRTWDTTVVVDYSGRARAHTSHESREYACPNASHESRKYARPSASRVYGERESREYARPNASHENRKYVRPSASRVYGERDSFFKRKL